ncbi:MAG TPA: polymorphic toxin type 46 domain-containing protein, partial [Polyangiaceae bacterium]
AALPILGWVGGARVAHWAVEKVGGEEAALWADGLMIAAGGVHGAIEGGGGAEGRGAPEAGGEEGAEVLAPDEPPLKDDAAEKEEEPEPITARDPAVGEDDAAAARPPATPEPTCATCDAAPPPPDDPAAAARKAIEDGTVWDRPSLKGVSQEEIDLAGRKGNSQDQIRARKKLAKRFYKQKAGMTAAEARNHMRGIDFDEPVTMGPPPAAPGAQVQYQVPGGRQGQYYADPDATPSQLGIHDQGATMGPDGWGTGPVAGKTPVTYDVDPSTQYMQSTAAPVKDTWSVPGHSYGTEGGATQRFIPSGSDGVSPSGGGPGN